MEIRWQRTALSDLEAIQDYLLERNPPAALRLVSELRQAALSPIEHPHRGRPGRVPGTRELVVSGTTYLIPYRVRGQVIEILRVFHGARKWPDDFEK
jgi:toxin ParE1/3/4